MPIPVPIPGGPLPVTSQDNTKAELFVAYVTQIYKSGTSGFTVGGGPAVPAITVPDGNNPTATKALELSTDKQQIAFRAIGMAMGKALGGGASGQVIGTTSDPVLSSATYVVIPEMTVTLTTFGLRTLATFSCTFSMSGTDALSFAIFLDNTQVAGTERDVHVTGTQPGVTASVQALLTPAAGSHTIDVRWKAIAGSPTAIGTKRNLVVLES